MLDKEQMYKALVCATQYEFNVPKVWVIKELFEDINTGPVVATYHTMHGEVTLDQWCEDALQRYKDNGLLGLWGHCDSTHRVRLGELMMDYDCEGTYQQSYKESAEESWDRLDMRVKEAASGAN